MSCECRIRVLPTLLINKIAAGEVVERPASVVKELVENSIDAGATRIAVTIEEGGRQLIRVADDGSGMTREELCLAVLPHSTSKIAQAADLYSITTMGFRGEALASISSVSKLRLVSATPAEPNGHEVNIAGEQLESSQAAGCPPGTIVEVRDLFFNVPARRKFLRAPSTEIGHINEQLARLALAHPGIGFELTHNRRVSQHLPPCATRLERIARLYGPELASALLAVERDERGLHLLAYAARPAQSRATAQWQYTFVNGRYIRDRFVQHAVRESYRGLMESNRHGVVFLFLTLDPSDLDVNVHPTKIEVRWADSNLIHSQVLSALRETFQRNDLVPTLRTENRREPPTSVEQDRIRREMATALKSAAPIQPAADGSRWQPGSVASETDRLSGSAAAASRATQPTGEHPVQQYERSGGLANGVDPLETWRSLYGAGPSEHRSGSTPAPDANHPPQAAIDGEIGVPRPRPRAMQMHNLYLVAETEEGIIIVDQHALHERVLYERLCERLAAGPLESQRLLLPETLTVTPSQVAVLESNSDLLAQLGIEVTPFGTDSVAVQAFPALLKDTDVVSFMRDLLDQLAQQAATPSAEVVIHNILDMMACKAAVKAGDRLTDQEIDALITQRHLIEKATSCPHGRPTMLRLTKADLDRQFKRT